MAFTAFPKALYKRLLKSSKIIDSTNAQTALQSILCGKPSTLYSYESKQNIEIGTSSYSLYDQLVSIMNDGEYSSPTHPYPISFYSIMRDTVRLCCKHSPTYYQDKNAKFSILSKYCRDITLTKPEFTEIVSNFEALATIAHKYNESQQKIKDTLYLAPPKNTFECDVINWMDQGTDKDLQTQIVNVLDINDKKNQKLSEKPQKLNKRTVDPILEYVPKTLHATQGTVSGWRNSILFQHPLSTMSRLNGNNDHTTYPYSDHPIKIEPYILLGLCAQATHPKLRLTGRKEDSVRIAMVMNGERTLMNVEDVLQSQVTASKNKNSVCTFHGYQTVPEMFIKNSLFFGGTDLSSIEILTINPYCKGIGILNNKLFWNPDLRIAEKIISSGYGTVEQFRFFKGKMKWNNNLWSNIQDRNIYGYISTVGNTSSSSAQLTKQMWSYHIENANDEGNTENGNSLWYKLLQHCFQTDTKDIESWLHLFTLLNQSNCNIRQEIYQLMEAHDTKITEQVKQWEGKQQLVCS